ncbi:MAG: dipeptidyl aminopeptidase/acylaminoacyl peptidase [Gammaproteobacteria bacterium]|jgi:dipeptidyl aminopeptidase/acylaminoacyl peptidase
MNNIPITFIPIYNTQKKSTMKLITSILLSFLLITSAFAQTDSKVMTPEILLTLNRVSARGISLDGNDIIYAVSKVDLEKNDRSQKYFAVSIKDLNTRELKDIKGLLKNDKVNSTGEFKLVSKEVKIKNVSAQDFHDDVPKANVLIYDELNYRHWDHWEDGEYGHIFIESLKDSKFESIDLMKGEPHDCPQKPFGGSEDYIWHPDGDKVLYVTKKMDGVRYASSTNSDIYQYNMSDGSTVNLTKSNEGYDNSPAYSPKGHLAFLRMKRDGYESDKNDIIVKSDALEMNLTAAWDGTVNSFSWSEKGDKIYFIAPVDGTVQLFETSIPKSGKAAMTPRQITNGQFDVSGIIGQSGSSLIVNRRDMNHATEIYKVNTKDGSMVAMSHANDELYNSISLSNVEKRMVKTTDNKDMLTWVIYPPNFDPAKKYPTLLYCQGGPQGALSQFYSYRWNFQVMAAQGYIIVAPNRRGMPGHGVEWNEQISGDYGGQNMKDYLSAIDDVSKESYVDKNSLGCIGASYGGYSAFYLAAIHENRFKTFIAHDGIFNWQSMYGTTEEMFFVNWDLGGAYWDKNNKVAQRTYQEFNPANKVDQWSKPILIIQGGLDYRVPIGQGLEAFQAAQLRGIKSKLLYFPEENHWVLSSQNALVWQREFFKWLKETM